MAYVVKKPLNIGGRRRVAGEVLQDDEVKSASVIRSGYVVKIDSGLIDVAEPALSAKEGSSNDGGINLPIRGENGSESTTVSPASLSESVRIIQLSSDKEVAEINKISDTTVLLILGALDKGTKAKAAIKARVEELKEESAGEA